MKKVIRKIVAGVAILGAIHVNEVIASSLDARELIDKFVDEMKRIPLHWAAWCNDVCQGTHLIKSGWDVNTTNARGDTPLHYTIHWNSTNMARLLIENGANVNFKNNEGQTPLHLAIERSMDVGQKNVDMVQLLIDSKADIHAEDKLGCTPFSNARRYGIREILELFDNIPNTVEGE